MGFNSFITYSEIRDYVEKFVDRNKEIAFLEKIGLSDEGREIQAVHITDQNQPIDNKEVVLIIIGRHGDELGTRVVGPMILKWLASWEAGNILKCQHIIVVPVANPDGCVKEIFGFPTSHISDLEKNSLVKIGLKYVPDVVLDIHSVGRGKYGFNWGGLEAVVIDNSADSGEDQYVLRAMADEMIQGAAREGYPFLLHTLEFYQNLRKKAPALSELAFNNHVNRVFYESFHSLTFGIEVNHFVLSPNDAARSGVAVIKSLLEMGTRVFPWEYYRGYPNRVLRGDFFASIRPLGKTAVERRSSRREIWSNRKFFAGSFIPYRKMENDHSINVIFKYSGKNMISGGLTVSFRIRGGPQIKRIIINGQNIKYYSKTDESSTYVFVDVEKVDKDDLKEIVAEF